MSRVSADAHGVPTAQMAAYYASFAAGGFAAVITEGIYTDDAFSQSYAHQPGLVTDEQQRGWRAVTEAVHAAACPIVAQLMHGGALSQCLGATVGPSAVAPLGAKMPDYGGAGPFPLPAEMSAAQIDGGHRGLRVVGRARTGRRIRRGRDPRGQRLPARSVHHPLHEPPRGCATAAAAPIGSGSLPRSSPRFGAACPPDFVVGVRLSQTKVNDVEHRWSGRSEAAVYFAAVAEAGADYVHIASEGRDWHEMAMIEPGLSVTALARAVTGRPVVANGGMHEPELARRKS